LRNLGYDVTETGETERILPSANCRESSSPVPTARWSRKTSGSTRPVAQIVTHAGVCEVQRYALSLA